MVIERGRPGPKDDFLFKPTPECLQKIKDNDQLISQLDGIDCMCDPIPEKYYNKGLSEEL